jgi:hypothetical protein
MVRFWNYIYVWKFISTVLELGFWAAKCLFSLDEIWTHTIETMQHQSLSLVSSAKDYPATSAKLKYIYLKVQIIHFILKGTCILH